MVLKMLILLKFSGCDKEMTIPNQKKKKREEGREWEKVSSNIHTKNRWY